MSRNRKVIAMQQGHLTVAEQERMESEEKVITVGDDQLNTPPNWVVGSVAKKEFRRIVEILREIEVVGNLDLNSIGAYCNAYAGYIKATKELNKSTLTVTKLTQFGEVIVENPLVNIQKKYADEMRKFAAQCGMTIDSRLKVATIKTTKRKQEAEDKFGNI